jgi:hypothetical protein
MSTTSAVSDYSFFDAASSTPFDFQPLASASIGLRSVAAVVGMGSLLSSSSPPMLSPMFGSSGVNGSADNVLGGLDLGMLSTEDQAIMNLVKDFRAQALETYRQPFIMVLMIVYGFVFLLSLAGNGLVLFVVLGNRSMRTTTNYFLLNMSVADLLGKLTSFE